MIYDAKATTPRPYDSTANIAAQNFDFFTFLGDTIYETASAVSPATADPYLNPAQALVDYQRKYREQLEPVNPNGFPGLQSFFASQANYTLLDNHELGNKQFTSGGAPAGIPCGHGVDPSDPTYDVNTTGTFMNKTLGFQTLVRAYDNYQPIREKTISAPDDPRIDGTQQLYFAQQWGAHSIFFNLDDRSYRDIELKTPAGGPDTGPRADNPGRTMLGRTQLGWFKQSLLDAQATGVTWKFVAISSPIDQVPFDYLVPAGAVAKDWNAGYRAERNELLKFIADNHIDHVVFLTTDDHQVRISELTYLTDPSDPTSVAPVPGAFQILTSPLGAAGVPMVTDHGFSNIKALADSLAAAQIALGMPPLGLDPSFPGLFNVFREGDPDADVLRQPVDFYSPDTFNYATLDVSPDGGSLTVRILGINNFAANTFPEPGQVGPERLVLSFQIDANPCTVSLAPSEASPGLVGEPITWTATAKNCGEAPVYQFNVGPAGGNLRVVRDFSPSNSFTWAPMQEGDYDVQVTVKEGCQAVQTTSFAVHYGVNSRVTGSEAVISPTANPLVALYSVPPSFEEGTVFVQFSEVGGNPYWRNTNTVTTVPGESTNFFVAGMLPNTTYQMRHVLSDGTSSSPLLFTTGAIPSTLVFPTFTVIQPPGPGSDLDQDMLFHQFIKSPNNTPNPLATDLMGQVVWYYDVSQSGFTLTFPGQSLVPGGTVLLLGTDRYAQFPALTRDVLREIDLAGNPLRETNIDAVNVQLAALGNDIIYSFNHDVQRLPNGETAVSGLTERTVNINGTPTDYVGMMIVVLDEDFRVAWAWDAFDHLDVNRGPVLGEVLQPGSTQPTAAVPRLPAVDWLHLNAVSWSPEDGNLVLSLRHQDWVIKVDYGNGAGDGHVIWRLGQGGDFTVNSTDPNPWFSHQHNAHYVDDTTLIRCDNGNTRYASDPTADSRGQVWTLDEQTMTATLVVNADLGSYSGALGAAQRLPNGNYSFTLGEQGPEPPTPPGQSIEVRPDGTRVYDLEVNRPEYRSFRMRTLYGGINDRLDNGGGGSWWAAASHSGQGFAPLAHFNSDSIVDPALAAYDAANVSVPADGVGSPTHRRKGFGASPDDLWAAIAAALTTSPKSLVTPTPPLAATPTGARAVLPPDEVRGDPFFAAGRWEDRRLAIFRAQQNPLSWADDPWAAVVGTDGTLGDWPFPAVSKD
jgi:3-phytase/alkaline phosphatase D